MFKLTKKRKKEKQIRCEVGLLGGVLASQIYDLLHEHGLGHLYIHRQRVDRGMFKETAMRQYKNE